MGPTQEEPQRNVRLELSWVRKWRIVVGVAIVCTLRNYLSIIMQTGSLSMLSAGGIGIGIRKPVLVKSLYTPSSPSTESKTMATPKWAQKTITLPPHKRGCHLITSKIIKEIGDDLSGFNVGLAHFLLQHTSASLTINENYDTDVRDDTETFLNQIVPEGNSAPWKHTMEGPDDMPAHIKSSIFGCTLMIPITNGHLNLGTWQGIWLCEHRDYPTPRKIVVTLNGI